MTETEFQTEVVAWAEGAGWFTYHNPDSRRSAAGFPDLVLLHPTRRLLWFAELKSAQGRVTDRQWEWIDGIQAVANRWPDAAVQVFVWRPADLPNIIRLLRNLSGGDGDVDET